MSGGSILSCSSRPWHHCHCCNRAHTLPWAPLCSLLRGVFDTVDEASYIPDVSAYLKLLETRVWPLLGISPTVHNTGGQKCAGMP